MSAWSGCPFAAARFPDLIPDVFSGVVSHGVAAGLLAQLLGVAWQAAARVRWPDGPAIVLGAGALAVPSLVTPFAVLDAGGVGWIATGLALGWAGLWARS